MTWRRYGTDPAGNPLDRFGLSRPVWLLGWVSFFTDMASEMIYPLLPLFLTRVLGAGAMSLGVIEGVAEGANSILKIISGWIADRTGQPKKLVLAGYGLSSLVRPLMGLVTAWPQVLALRFTDRLGKGIRSSPRDALLARFAPEKTRGRVYGFHRAMDHAGAVAGPLVATVFLYFYPGGVPLALHVDAGAGTHRHRADSAPAERAPDRRPAAIAATSGSPMPDAPMRPCHHASTSRWPSSSCSRWATPATRSSCCGSTTSASPPSGFRCSGPALHVVKMTSSVIGGALSDRFGRRDMIALGYLWYAAIYAAFAWFDTLPVVIVTFLAYGVYFGFTEGVEKAWVADMAPADARGTAFGIYNAALGFGGLAASVMFGAIWTRVSPAAAFLTGACLALAASLLLYLAFSNATESSSLTMTACTPKEFTRSPPRSPVSATSSSSRRTSKPAPSATR